MKTMFVGWSDLRCDNDDIGTVTWWLGSEGRECTRSGVVLRVTSQL